jgi:cullin 4
MIARFKPGKKELSLSAFQAVILLLFNDVDELSYADIKAQTRLSMSLSHLWSIFEINVVCTGDDELRLTLQSLACGKKRVLKKHPLGRDVKDGDVFRYNADFEDPRAKVHINSIQAKVSVCSFNPSLYSRLCFID